jgi:hypothetical protein
MACAATLLLVRRCAVRYVSRTSQPALLWSQCARPARLSLLTYEEVGSCQGRKALSRLGDLAQEDATHSVSAWIRAARFDFAAYTKLLLRAHYPMAWRLLHNRNN